MAARSWGEIPEGTLVYAHARNPLFESDFDVEGNLELREEDDLLYPYVAGRPVAPHSIIALAAGLVERELEVGFMGYGPAWKVSLLGGRLHYWNRGWGKNDDLIMPLSRLQWDEFVKMCDDIRIWDWNRRYSPPPGEMATDNPHWNVVVEANGRRLVSAGYQVFPPKFSSFVDALGKLIGGVKIE